MRRLLCTAYCSLITSFLFLLSSCTHQTPAHLQTSLIVYRFDPPVFIEYSTEYKPIKEIPFSIPANCGLNNTFPAPIGPTLLIELNCPNGQTVLFLDLESGVATQPITDTDVHFLAWTPDGKSVYLKVDSLGNSRIVRISTKGTPEFIPITEFTYDLSASPDAGEFTFTFSRGLGYGSELYLAQNNGRTTQLLLADQFNYISFTRFSPDGKRIAFIKIPDTQTPFTVGELWVIPATVTFANKTPSSMENGMILAQVDAGHGYAANWSPDGKQIAFVVRENPDDEKANQSSDALISNIYMVDVDTGKLTQITDYSNARVETPCWSPDGNTLAFNGVINDRMNVFIVDMESVGVGSSNPEIKALETGSTCCPAWMRK